MARGHGGVHACALRAGPHSRFAHMRACAPLYAPRPPPPLRPSQLNAVAPLLSMCFLLCYACMNLNSFLLDILKDPNWRPRFKYFHWSTGLLGFLLCTTVMFIIQWLYALIAWVVVIMLLVVILRTNLDLDWGSALQGLRFQVAIRALLSVDMRAHLAENWKPQLLLLYVRARAHQSPPSTGGGRMGRAPLLPPRAPTEPSPSRAPTPPLRDDSRPLPL